MFYFWFRDLTTAEFRVNIWYVNISTSFPKLSVVLLLLFLLLFYCILMQPLFLVLFGPLFFRQYLVYFLVLPVQGCVLIVALSMIS